MSSASICARIAGVCRPLGISAFGLFTMPFRMPAGTDSEKEVIAVSFGNPSSAKVGTPGWSLSRLPEVTASARSLPL